MRSAAAAALLAVGLSGAAAPAALGHAAFAGGSPAPGERVEAPPARVALTFTEPLRSELSEATLRDARGRRVPAAASVRGRRIVLSPDRELPRGAYLVRWRTVSTEDAHPLEGSFGFGVGVAPAAGAGGLEESPLAGGGWARALSHGLLYAALLLFTGALLCRALLGREWPLDVSTGPDRQIRPVERFGREARAHTLVADAGLAAVALAAIAAVVDAANAAGGLSLDGLEAYLLNGTPGIARIGLVALLAVALALANRAPRPAALAGLAALGCVVASGHANSAPARELAIAADWTHLAAGAVWLGGAATILAVWGPALRDAGARGGLVQEVLPRFGRIALPAFLVVAVAGAVNAIVELSAIGDLWDSAYGRVLLAKIALVAGAAAAAYRHAYRRGSRRVLPALRLEVALGAGVVLAAGLLVAFPLPPRQLDDATAGAAAAIPACDPCPLPAARPGELSVAGQAGAQVVAAWLRRERGELSGTIRTLTSRGRPGTGAIEVPGGSARPCGRGCATFRTAPAPDVLRVNVRDQRRTHTATLPATWRQGQSDRAHRFLARAERTMRALRSVREEEVVTSGPGTYAVTRYRLRAPDRMAFATGRGVRSVQIDRTQWLRTPGAPWRRSEVPGGVPFRTRSWFRWTPYARSIEVLAERGGTVELALADPATPVWMRLTIERRTGRVLHERLTARARFVERRFHAFDAPVEIEPPQGAVNGG